MPNAINWSAVVRAVGASVFAALLLVLVIEIMNALRGNAVEVVVPDTEVAWPR
jgi:hypothetical protein